MREGCRVMTKWLDRDNFPMDNGEGIGNKIRELIFSYSISVDCRKYASKL